MKFTVNDVHYDFDESSLTNKEVMRIEAKMGCTFGEWADLLKRNSMYAQTTLVWVALLREKPDTKFDDIQFTIKEMADANRIEEEPDPPTPAGAEAAILPEPSLSEPPPDLEETPTI